MRRRAGMLMLGLAFIGGTGCMTTRLVEGGFTKEQAQERARREQQEQQRQERERAREEKTS
jgi:hypothetical protein